MRLPGIALFAVLALAAPASAAESVSLSFTPATPRAYDYFAVTVSGHTDTSGAYVVARYFGPGRTDAGCTDRWDQNPGDIAIQQNPAAPGDYSFTQADSDRVRFPHGRYLYCGYVSDADGNTLAHTEKTLTVSDRNAISMSIRNPRIADGGFATVHFHGFNDSDSGSVVLKRNSGTGGCANKPEADSGTPFDVSDAGGILAFDNDAEVDAGQVSADDRHPLAPGQYRLCAWLVDASGVLAGPSSTAVTVLPPHATLNVTLPFLAAARTDFAVPFSFRTSTFEKLFVALLPGGRLGQGCPATRGAAGRGTVNLLRGGSEDVFDVGSEQLGVLIPRPGDYRVCFWIQRTATDGRGAVAVGDVIRVLPHGHAPAQFSGSTSQSGRQQGIVFGFAGGRVYGLTVRERERCTRGGHHYIHEGETSLARFDVGAGGRFHKRFGLSGPGGAVVMTGRVAGNRASGSFTETVRMGNGAVCHTGRVTFRAKVIGHFFA